MDSESISRDTSVISTETSLGIFLTPSGWRVVSFSPRDSPGVAGERSIASSQSGRRRGRGSSSSFGSDGAMIVNQIERHRKIGDN